MSLVIFCLFDLSTSLVKLSTLAMLWRLVRATKSPMRIVTLVAAGGVVGSGLLFIFITVFQCRWVLPFPSMLNVGRMPDIPYSPMWQYWTLSAEPQACIDESVHLLVAGLINTITDFAVVILPIKTVAGLCLPRKQYFVLIVLFCAGFCACIAGCVRTYYTYVFTESYDRTVSIDHR